MREFPAQGTAYAKVQNREEQNILEESLGFEMASASCIWKVGC